MKEPYVHTVQYYETDRMGISHHSNYIRWMEESRLFFLKQIGWDYDKLEAEGIISPVTGIEGKYRKTTTYPDQVTIDVVVEEFRGVRLKLQYTMTNSEGDLVFEGKSEHCFLNEQGLPMRMKKEYPEFYQTLFDLANESK